MKYLFLHNFLFLLIMNKLPLLFLNLLFEYLTEFSHRILTRNPNISNNKTLKAIYKYVHNISTVVTIIIESLWQIPYSRRVIPQKHKKIFLEEIS